MWISCLYATDCTIPALYLMTVPVAVTWGHLGDITKASFEPTPVSIVFCVFELMSAM